jgi:hypothetical protein
LTFLTPAGAFVALVALVPVAWLFQASRNADRAARVLKLARAGRRVQLVPALLATAACACAGLAAAQPALRVQHNDSTRARSEILYVVDVSRSMAASAAAGDASRLARARAVVAQLRADTADVPSGLGGMTDRVLPYLLPTPDRAVFAATLRQSVAIESPPPREVNITATTFDALDSIAGSGWFDGNAQWRTCVLVTDGESRTFSPVDVADALNAARCRLIAVRVGGTGDRVYAGGVPEAGYVPDPAAAAKVAALIRAAGGVTAGSAAAAAPALRRLAERGPLMRTTPRETVHPLAPWVALLALVLTVTLAGIRIRVRSLHPRPTIAG